MNFYIIRHGETKQVRDHMEYDNESIKSAPILEDSITTITEISKYLKDIKTDYNVSSPYLRCRQTVQIVTKTTGKEFEFDERLGEYLLIIGKEYHEELVARISSFLDDIKKKGYENVLVCTHGAVIAALKHLVISGKFKPEQLMDFPHPSVLTVIEGGKLKELKFE